MDGILTNTDTRDALMLAAYEAERRAFSRPVFIGAFFRRGLRPFDAKLMQANVKAILGLMETAETPIEAARRAASEVIQAAQARVQEAKAGTSCGKAVVVRGVVHSPFRLLKRQREIEEEEAKEKAAKATRAEECARERAEQEKKKVDKAAARKNRRCRMCVSKEHRGGKGWRVCQCGAFWVCPGCAKTLDAGIALARHLNECDRMAESESESESRSDGGGSSSDERVARPAI